MVRAGTSIKTRARKGVRRLRAKRKKKPVARKVVKSRRLARRKVHIKRAMIRKKTLKFTKKPAKRKAKVKRGFKIGKIRGLLYKKIKEIKRAKKKPLMVQKLRYKFSLKEPKIVQFPKIKKIERTDIKYALIEPFAYARIKWDKKEGRVKYNIIEPELLQREALILKRLENYITAMISVDVSKLSGTEEMISYLQGCMEKALAALEIRLSGESYVKILYYIYRNFAGLNEIEPLMHDPYIEDIGCVGTNANVYVVHRVFGSIETNIVFKDDDYLENFVIKIAEKCGRYISYAQPLFDGSLPDGSRVQATLAKDVTTKGSSFSIRKFRKNPFSPVDLINMGTTSPEMMAYLWTLIENDANILVCGGVATGKTTFLNSLSMFIQPEKKIVSIEDTRELQLPHENWIPAVTRPGFGIPDMTGVKYGEVDLFQLLKESFRQNPNYTIIGEIRGKEAYVLFQGMASGNPSLGTMHAGSVDDVIKRLETPPIELPPSLIESLDAIIIMVNAREISQSARRVREVEEIVSINQQTMKVSTKKVFMWEPAKDIFRANISSSEVLRKIAFRKGISFKTLLKEVEEKAKVIDWIRRHEVVQYDEFSALINFYHKDREAVIRWVKRDLDPYKMKPKKEIMRMFKK